MPVISVPHAFHEDELYVDLRSIFGHSLFLKCEGFNFAGSIKLKAATAMVEAAERDGSLTPAVDPRRVLLRQPRRRPQHDRRQQGLPVPVRHRHTQQPVDPPADGSPRQRTSTSSPNPTPERGLLGARLDYIHALCASDDRYLWLNQYTNPNNWNAHYTTTAPAIIRQFPRPRRPVRRRRHHRNPHGLRPVPAASGTPKYTSSPSTASAR